VRPIGQINPAFDAVSASRLGWPEIAWSRIRAKEEQLDGADRLNAPNEPNYQYPLCFQ
jgi:hypothetical protein